MAAFAVLATMCAAAREPEVVLYVNEDGERPRRALAALDAAIDAAGVRARHAVRLVHLVVNPSDPDEMRRRMRDALAQRPAALIAPSSLAALIAREIGSGVPVIFGSRQDPVGMGVVGDLHHPDGGLTGFTSFLPLEDKQVELLHAIVPRARRLGVIADEWWAQDPASKALDRAAAERGMKVERFIARSAAGLAAELRRPEASLMDAWYVPLSNLSFESPALVPAALARLGKPAVYSSIANVAAGGLAAYESGRVDHNATWARMLGYVLDGVPTSAIPVERPKTVDLAINVPAARGLAVAIPKAVYRRATQLYP
jgi:putative ABC transport system substrate-binding protein